MPRGYTISVRLVLVFVCVFLGWSIYSLIVYRELSLINFQGQDYLATIGFSIGLYAFVQLLLRYLSTPNVTITLSNGPHRLGPSQALQVAADAPEEERKRIELLNIKRQYATHHIQVWNCDVPWYICPLIQRIAVEGCHIRFRYTRIYNGKEEPMLNGEWLFGRWNDNPEPVTSTGFDLGTAVTNRRLAKLFPTEKNDHIDAYPFTVAFAMKKEGDDGFYHFNDESYAFGFGWSNPHWYMGLGTYRVDIRLTGYGLLRAVTSKFRLVNSGSSLSDWMPENWQ